MTEFLILSLGVFLGSCVSGFAGFAFSATAGAVLLHFFEPILVVPLMMLCSIASQSATLLMLRKSIQFRNTTWLLFGGLAGVPLAIYALTLIDPGAFRSAFGLFLVVYAAYLLIKPTSAALQSLINPLAHTAVGFGGGLVGGLTAMPGAIPTMWCELRGATKEQQRALVQPFILAMQIFAVLLLSLHPAGFHPDMVKDLLLVLPALAAGTWFGMALFHRVDPAVFRKCTLMLLLFSGLGMIGWQELNDISASTVAPVTPLFAGS